MGYKESAILDCLTLTVMAARLSRGNQADYWQELVESGLIGLAVTTSGGRYITSNATLRKLLGYQESDIRHILLPDFTDEKGIPGTRNPFAVRQTTLNTTIRPGDLVHTHLTLYPN